MPSITQKDLDALHQEIEDAQDATAHAQGRFEEATGEWLQERAVFEARIRQFGELLDKIQRAAYGVPLLDHRNAGAVMGHDRYGIAGDSEPWRYNPHSGAPLTPAPSVDPTRELLTRNDDLHARLAEAESRLSAVAAVVDMAREHKA